MYVNGIATISPVFGPIDLFNIPFQFNTLVLPLKDNTCIVKSVYLPNNNIKCDKMVVNLNESEKSGLINR